jgi:hypothetical protein
MPVTRRTTERRIEDEKEQGTWSLPRVDVLMSDPTLAHKPVQVLNPGVKWFG